MQYNVTIINHVHSANYSQLNRYKALNGYNSLTFVNAKGYTSMTLYLGRCKEIFSYSL